MSLPGMHHPSLLSHTNSYIHSGFERKYASLNGVKYSYLYSSPPISSPNTQTLLFIHGFPDSAYGWRRQLTHFSSKYVVIAPDMMGYNETETPANLERYSSKHVCGMYYISREMEH